MSSSKGQCPGEKLWAPAAALDPPPPAQTYKTVFIKLQPAHITNHSRASMPMLHKLVHDCRSQHMAVTTHYPRSLAPGLAGALSFSPEPIFAMLCPGCMWLQRMQQAGSLLLQPAQLFTIRQAFSHVARYSLLSKPSSGCAPYTWLYCTKKSTIPKVAGHI